MNKKKQKRRKERIKEFQDNVERKEDIKWEILYYAWEGGWEIQEYKVKNAGLYHHLAAFEMVDKGILTYSSGVFKIVKDKKRKILEKIVNEGWGKSA